MTMSSENIKENKNSKEFDDDMIESLKAYFKVKESDDADLHRFIKWTRVDPHDD